MFFEAEPGQESVMQSSFCFQDTVTRFHHRTNAWEPASGIFHFFPAIGDNITNPDGHNKGKRESNREPLRGLSYSEVA